MLPDQKGFTLIEIFFVMALISIISGIAYTSYVKSLPDKRLKQAATQLFLDLQEAKSLTVLNRVNMRVNFDTDNQQYSMMDQKGNIIKTVPLSSFKGGIKFGPGPATSPKPNKGSFGENYISFDPDGDDDWVNFRPNGMASRPGYAYLTNDQGSLCYAIGVLNQTGSIRIYKTASGTWP